MHAVCLQFDPALIWGLSIGHVGIWACYMVISTTFMRPCIYDRFPAAKLFFWFIHLCGWSHFVSSMMIWTPEYWLSLIICLATFAVSLPAAVAFVGLARHWSSEDEKDKPV